MTDREQVSSMIIRTLLCLNIRGISQIIWQSVERHWTNDSECLMTVSAIQCTEYKYKFILKTFSKLVNSLLSHLHTTDSYQYD